MAILHPPGSNLIIDPTFQIWQRYDGSTPFTTSAAYTSDRKRMFMTTSTLSIDRVAGENVNGYTDTEYGLEATFTSGAVAASNAYIQESVEDVRTLHGTRATINILADIPVGNSIACSCVQHTGSALLSYTNPANDILVGTGSPTLYTTTIDIPSIGTATISDGSYLGFRIWFDAGTNFDDQTGGLGNQPDGIVKLYAWQIREGTRDSIIEIPRPRQNWDDCYRYYYRHSQTVAGRHFCNCYAASGNQAFGIFDCPNKFRSPPEFAYPALSDFGLTLGNQSFTPPTIYTLIWNNVNKPAMYMQFGAGTFVPYVGWGGAFYSTTSTYIELSSEL